MEKQFTIFETVEFKTEEDFNIFVDNLSKETATKIIDVCLNYCNDKSLFSLSEAFIVYKSLNKLKENEKDNLPSTNPNRDISY